MPAITLTAEAKNLLLSYRWPGNIRQLRNTTEQISILETSREITVDVLNSYLPAYEGSNLPVINKKESNSFIDGEREMLYKIIFDMRKEINDIKAKLETTDRGNIHKLQSSSYSEDIAQDFIPSSYYEAKDEIYDNVETINIEHFEDSALSLEEAEKEMIKKSLERNNGKRKKCAEELKISERTLYRKIKEYNLE